MMDRHKTKCLCFTDAKENIYSRAGAIDERQMKNLFRGLFVLLTNYLSQPNPKLNLTFLPMEQFLPFLVLEGNSLLYNE